ncbi:Myosin Light Chain Kinase 2, Skeletal/Cardiac Muscle, partial [Manis pentadactyla]
YPARAGTWSERVDGGIAGESWQGSARVLRVHSAPSFTVAGKLRNCSGTAGARVALWYTGAVEEGRNSLSRSPPHFQDKTPSRGIMNAMTAEGSLQMRYLGAPTDRTAVLCQQQGPMMVLTTFPVASSGRSAASRQPQAEDRLKGPGPSPAGPPGSHWRWLMRRVRFSQCDFRRPGCRLPVPLLAPCGQTLALGERTTNLTASAASILALRGVLSRKPDLARSEDLRPSSLREESGSRIGRVACSPHHLIWFSAPEKVFCPGIVKLNVET